MNKLTLYLGAAIFALSIAGCGSDHTTPQSNNNEVESTSGACQLLQELGDCGACWSGDTTCTYGDITVTEGSCQQCQAMVALYIQLCESGNTDSQEAIEAGMTCTDLDE